MLKDLLSQTIAACLSTSCQLISLLLLSRKLAKLFVAGWHADECKCLPGANSVMKFTGLLKGCTCNKNCMYTPLDTRRPTYISCVFRI
jgi:pyruvate formate-lyase activating enzyme-like uncharacterized protein